MTRVFRYDTNEIFGRRSVMGQSALEDLKRKFALLYLIKSTLLLSDPDDKSSSPTFNRQEKFEKLVLPILMQVWQEYPSGEEKGTGPCSCCGMSSSRPSKDNLCYVCREKKWFPCCVERNSA